MLVSDGRRYIGSMNGGRTFVRVLWDAYIQRSRLLSLALSLSLSLSTRADRESPRNKEPVVEPLVEPFVEPFVEPTGRLLSHDRQVRLPVRHWM